MRARRSPIWKLSSEEFKNLVKSKNSYCDVARHFGLHGGSNSTTVKSRIKIECIDDTHIRTAKRPIIKVKSRPIEEYLTVNSTISRCTLKTRLIKEGLLKSECYLCGLKEWNSKPISLQLDHINGVNDDNSLSNLRILCPNCHSQTLTFSGKNRRIQLKDINKCALCSKAITKSALKCAYCEKHSRSNTKAAWPDDNILLKWSIIRTNLSIAKELNVSEASVRKRLKKIEKRTSH